MTKEIWQDRGNGADTSSGCHMKWCCGPGRATRRLAQPRSAGQSTACPSKANKPVLWDMACLLLKRDLLPGLCGRPRCRFFLSWLCSWHCRGYQTQHSPHHPARWRPRMSGPVHQQVRHVTDNENTHTQFPDVWLWWLPAVCAPQMTRAGYQRGSITGPTSVIAPRLPILVARH